MVFSDARYRMACAIRIEQRIRILTQESGGSPCICIWNLDQGWENTGPHRLDISIKSGMIKAYFTDAELMAYDGPVSNQRTDARLRLLLSELEQASSKEIERESEPSEKITRRFDSEK